jgi:phosphoglycolate phosphatase-like HAD superfamily hydrolase
MRGSRPTVFLFDIDGTLISTGGAGRRAMAGAFMDVHGPRGAAAIDFSFAGMTDRAILRGGLEGVGVACDEESMDRVLDRYLARLGDEMQRTTTYQIHPGVTSVLAWLSTIDRTAIGLGTGNVKRGAYAKLVRGALDGSFAFGGFGCDAEDRAELLRIGARRGSAAVGAPLEECRVVVIGDTPKDVAAAQRVGAECIGVGTGGFEPQALVALGAHAAFATLAEEGVREALLSGW